MTPSTSNKAQASLGRKLAGGFFFQAISNFSGLLVSLVLMPVVIKQAGSETFGSYVVLSALLGFVAQACTLGAGYKCRRQLPAQPDARARAALFVPNASFQLLACLAATVMLLAGLGWVQDALLAGSPPLAWWIIPLALGATFMNGLSDDYFRYTHRMRIVALVALARAFCHAGIVIPFAMGPDPLTPGLLLVAQSLGTLVPASVLWVMIAREIPLRFRLDSWAQHRWDIRFGLPLLTAVLVEGLLATGDRYILAGLLSPRHVGAYAAAFALGSLILLVPKVVAAVLPAALSQAVDQGFRVEAAGLLNRVLQFYFLLALPFVVGSALMARPLLELLADGEVAGLASRAVPLIALASVLYGHTWIVFSSLFVEMDTGRWFRANAAAAVVSIVLNVILISIFRSIDAAAVAMVVSYAVSCSIIERQRSREWPFRLGRDAIWKSLAGTLAMSAAVVVLARWPALQSTKLSAAAVPAAAGVLVYALALWRLDALPIADLRRWLRPGT